MNWHILGLATGLAGIAAALTIAVAFAHNLWLGSRGLRSAIAKRIKQRFTKKKQQHVRL